MFKGCVADCPVVHDSFSRSQLKASFQYLGIALHNPKQRRKFVFILYFFLSSGKDKKFPSSSSYSGIIPLSIKNGFSANCD